MPNSPLSSNACAHCRIEPREVAGERLLRAGLAVLALLSLGLSMLPLALKAVLAAAVCAQSAWQWRRMRPVAPVFELSAAGVHVDGVLVDAFVVHARGPVRVVCWHTGRRVHRHVLWPGALVPGEARELRLAANRMAMAGLTPGLAP